MNIQKKRLLKKYAWCYFFVMPTMIGLLILNIYPALQSFLLAFTETGDFGAFRYVGLDKIREVLSEKEIWEATFNTFVYLISIVPLATILSLVFAVILNQKIKGLTIYRTLFFLPVVAAPTAVALLWRWIFNTEYGILNYALSWFGLKNNIPWLTDPILVKIPVIVVSIWSIVGYNLILFLAGLQNIPSMYYEAAKIDGASSLQSFFKITVPLVSPTTFFVVITTTIQTLQIFDIIYVMVDSDNPSFFEAESLVTMFFRRGFRILDLSYASVVVLLLLGIIFIFTAFNFYAQKKWVQYAS